MVYGASISYLFAGSATALVASFAALPLLLKFPIKLAWIAPNVYHLAAGLRHLVRLMRFRFDSTRFSLNSMRLGDLRRIGMFVID